MRKKLVSCILVVCMLLTMLPTMAWAEEASPTDIEQTPAPVAEPVADSALYIDKGEVKVTATGYTGKDKDGTDVSVNWTDGEAHTLTVTQTPDTGTGNRITVSGGNPTITLSGVNMSKNENNKPGAVSVSGSGVKATIMLDGINTLGGGYQRSGGLAVTGGAEVTINTIDGTGILNRKNEGETPLIYVDSTSTVIIEGGTINAINSGAAAAGIGSARFAGAGTIIINGGYVTAKGTARQSAYASGLGGSWDGSQGKVYQNAVRVEINGGTVIATGSNAKGYDIQANEVVINGGAVVLANQRINVTPKNDEGKEVAVAKLLFDEADTEVTVKNGEKTWSAKTDGNGVITTYLAADVTSLTATIGEVEKTADVKYGVAFFGGTGCTCGTDGDISWSADLADMTLYKDMQSAVRSISASYEIPDTCSAEVHPGYNVVFDIVAKDGEGNEVADAAVYENGKITLNRVNGVSEYTVTVKAETENKQVAVTQDVTVTISEETAGAIKWSRELADVTLYKDVESAVRDSISASYVVAETVAAGYGNVTVTLKSVKDANGNDVNGAVTFENGKLTMNKADGVSKYTVTLEAKTENGSVSDTQDVIVEATQKEGFDISLGSITVTAGEDENAGKVVFKQGSKIIAVTPDTPVEINGSSLLTGGSAITIKDCSPTIVLHNLDITCNRGNYAKCTALSTILIDGTADDTVNLLLSGTNKLDRTAAGDGNYNNSCGIEIKEATLNIDCIDHEGKECTDTACKNKLIVEMTLGGGGRGAAIGSGRDKEGLAAQPDGFTLTINGGYIDVIAGSGGASIGVGDTSAISDDLANKVAININDGYVKATAGDDSVAIGSGKTRSKSLKEGVVTVTVAGGTVEAVSNAGTGKYAAILASDVTITGTADMTVSGNVESGSVEIEGNANLELKQKNGWVEGQTGTSGGDIKANLDVSDSAKVTATGGVTGEVEVAAGSSINIDGTIKGTVTAEGGATIKEGVTLPAGMGTTTIPAGMIGEVEADDETDALTLPAGTSVKNEDGSYTVLLDKGSVDSEGSLDSETPTATVKTPDGKPVVGNADGTFTIPAGSTVNGAEIPAEAGTVTVPTENLDEVKVDDAGNTALPAGTVVKTETGTTTYPDGASVAEEGTVDTEGTKVTENTDGSVTITDKDGNETTITPAVGEKVTVNSDGTVTLPKDSPVTITKGEETTTVTPAGESATVSPDGTVELPAGSAVTTDEGTTTLPAGTGTVTLPTDKLDEVTSGDDGVVQLPAGTVIETAEGKTTLPDGGSVNTEGAVATDGTTITEKVNGTVEITKGGETTTITPPAEGGSITVKPDGTVEVPAGSTVEKPDGSSDTLTNGGTVDKDGAVTETPVTPPAGDEGDKPVTPPAGDEGDKPTPQPPYGGYYPSYTPSVTPAAPSVDSSSLNNAALAVGSAIKDGSAELTPVNGYTKDEVVKLQKESKLEMSIEKKTEYSAADKKLIDNAITKAGGAVSDSVMYFDITVVLKHTDTGAKVAEVSDTEKAISITVDLNDALQKAAKDGKFLYAVRCHEGVTTFLETKLNAAKTAITFESSDFSTYAVVAMDKAVALSTTPADDVVTPEPEKPADKPAVDEPIVDEPVVDEPVVDEAPADDAEPSGGNVGLWIGIGIVALAAIVVVLAVMAARKKRK